MRARKLPPLERLIELFDYDPYTGVLTRKTTGKEAGSFCADLHRVVCIDRVKYYVHRIVWKMFYKREPGTDLMIDHINGCPHDNSIENLRRVKARRNSKNNKSRRLSLGPLTPA